MAMDPALAVAPVMTTGVVVPKLKVGGGKGPELVGADVTAAVRATDPVKPLAGVTVIVETLPVPVPSTTLTLVALMANVGPTLDASSRIAF
jgi:hypothetical protein